MKIAKKICVLFAVAGMVSFFSCSSSANVDNSSAAATSSSSSSSKSKSSLGSSGGILSSSSSSSSGSIREVNDKLPPAPAKASEAPKYTFTGASLQIELENMYYDGFMLVGDSKASKSYALKLLNDSSWAIAEVSFPAGTYEAVANVLAPDSNHSRFNLYINNDSYLIYGSEPPIGKYELTTRAPASFTLDAQTTVTVKIQQNDIKNAANNGQNGMTIDYISFKKTK